MASKSYTWGCSAGLYTYGTCKFAKSASKPRKFQMKKNYSKAPLPAEMEVSNVCHDLADKVAPLHQIMAPDCYKNMEFFDRGGGCRIGRRERGRPYSGVTTVVDFCAHSHQDTSNMIGKLNL